MKPPPKTRGATASFAPWGPAEDVVLRTAYLAGGIKAAMVALPHRTTGALFHRAIRLGFKRRRRWTKADDATLCNLWGAEPSLSEIAARLGRSKITTYWRAQKLGLPLGCPDGWEYLSHAAARTGYTTGQLRGILEAAGVEIERSTTRGSKRRGKRHQRPFHIVMPESVDAAVAEWLASEPLESAARRHGLRGEQLAAKLERIGIRKPTPRKHRWRVTELDVARAIA